MGKTVSGFLKEEIKEAAGPLQVSAGHNAGAEAAIHAMSQVFVEEGTDGILLIGHLQDPVTWYGINYTGTQMTQWDSQNKGTRTSPARLSFVLEVPLRHLRPSVIYSVPCDRILQMAY